MIYRRIILMSLALSLTYAPVWQDDTDPSLRTLRKAGFVIEGRDPCYGTGLCCALLPANKESEVYYVTLPDGDWNEGHLKLIERFQNLAEIRSKRSVSVEEFVQLKKHSSLGTRLLVTFQQ